MTFQSVFQQDRSLPPPPPPPPPSPNNNSASPLPHPPGTGATSSRELEKLRKDLEEAQEQVALLQTEKTSFQKTLEEAQEEVAQLNTFVEQDAQHVLNPKLNLYYKPKRPLFKKTKTRSWNRMLCMYTEREREREKEKGTHTHTHTHTHTITRTITHTHTQVQTLEAEKEELVEIMHLRTQVSIYVFSTECVLYSRSLLPL